MYGWTFLYVHLYDTDSSLGPKDTAQEISTAFMIQTTV